MAEYGSGKFRSGTAPGWLIPTSEFLLWFFHFGAPTNLRWPSIDRLRRTPNNPPMPRPDAARRVKSYSSATGYVFQYHFFEVERVSRGAKSGTEYCYMVSADRQATFPLRIFVDGAAVEAWKQRAGHALTGTEEYAVAKLRLFQAFDEDESLAAPPAGDIAGRGAQLFVDESNLDALLERLDPDRPKS
jgi:hypothetical protein